MVQRGRRAVYDAEAIALERPTPGIETEYRRKVRMFEHCWLIVARGKMLRRLPPLYFAEILSHRHLRYASRAAPPRRARDEHRTRRRPRRLGLRRRARRSRSRSSRSRSPGRGLPRYYALVTWATVVALWNYLRRGVPATWDAAEGTR